MVTCGWGHCGEMLWNLQGWSTGNAAVVLKRGSRGTQRLLGERGKAARGNWPLMACGHWRRKFWLPGSSTMRHQITLGGLAHYRETVRH